MQADAKYYCAETERRKWVQKQGKQNEANKVSSEFCKGQDRGPDAKALTRMLVDDILVGDLAQFGFLTVWKQKDLLR